MKLEPKNNTIMSQILLYLYCPQVVVMSIVCINFPASIGKRLILDIGGESMLFGELTRRFRQVMVLKNCFFFNQPDEIPLLLIKPTNLCSFRLWLLTPSTASPSFNGLPHHLVNVQASA